MSQFGCLILFLCCTTLVCGHIVTETSDGFTVSVGGVKIFQHSKMSPMLFVGQGQTQFLEGLGNFHIKNYIQQKIPLSTYIIDHQGSSDVITMEGGGYSVNVTFEHESKNTTLLVHVANNNDQMPFTYSWLEMVATQDEMVFGGGEQYSHFNLRERTYSFPEVLTVLRSDDLKYPIWAREQGVGRDKSSQVTFYADLKTGGGGAYHTTYFPQPTFVSTRNYSMHYTGSNFMVMDFSNPLQHEMFIKGTVDMFRIHADPSVTSLVTDLSSYLGRMPMLPDWTREGITIGVQGGTQVMLQKLKTVEDAGVKVTGIWIQDWSGDIHTYFGKRVFWNWKLNTTLYNDWNATVQSLKNKGIRILSYINPNLNQDGDVFKAANAGGYLLKDKQDQTLLLDFGGFKCGTIDLTNPAAFQWYKAEVLQKNMIDIGLGGWMADFGEYVSPDAKFSSGNPGDMVHNKWPVLWAQLNREAVEERGKLGEVVFFMRAGGAGSSNYSTLMWAGDQDVDFTRGDGLPSVVPAALSMGVCGIGMTHFDIGGYTTFGSMGLTRSAELLIRSGEMAVFTPYMRSHEGNQPGANIQVYSNPSMLQQFSRLVSMFTMLSNYTKNITETYIDTGIPVQRPMFMADETDMYLYTQKYQYMYGPDLIVAPVIVQNVTSWTAYLPKGDWYHIWSMKNFTGPVNVTVNAPLGETPVFARTSSPYSDIFHSIGKNRAIPYVPPTQKPNPHPVPNPNHSTRLNNSSFVLCCFIHFLFLIKQIFL